MMMMMMMWFLILKSDQRIRIVPGIAKALRIALLNCSLALGCAETALSAEEPIERARIPLFRETQQEFSSVPGTKDFAVRLPQHVGFRAGSTFRFRLRPASEPFAIPAAIAFGWNGQVLVTTNLTERPDTTIVVEAAVPEEHLTGGINLLSLRLIPLVSNETHSVSVARWSLRRSECVLDLVFTRLPLFEELSRFPETATEEKLLYQNASGSDRSGPGSPWLSLLVPGRCAEIHLRTMAIIGARLGQIDYFDERDCRVAPLESWKAESAQRNCILVARRDQLGGIEISPPVTIGVADLARGEGLLAEFFVGPPTRQRRIFVVSGADDLGLERAALMVGSSPAMATLSGSPAVVNQAPVLYVIPANEPVSGRIDGLYQIQEFLKQDRFGRQAAYLIPAGPSLNRVQFLLSLWMHLGRELAGAPVLWPEVVTFQPGAAPDQRRLSSRNVLALGAVNQWSAALPSGHKPPVVRMPSTENDTVFIQGRSEKRSSFDPTLCFVQMLPSPWSTSNMLVLAGGWLDYDLPATKRLLLDPTVPGQLGGNLAAIDELGRNASYDLRHVANESFAQRLRRSIPAGISLKESAQRAENERARQAAAKSWNYKLSVSCALFLSFLIGVRLLFMWQQARLRQRAHAAERAAGGSL